MGLIGGTLRFVCMTPQTVHCGEWLHFTEHRNTQREADSSGSLHTPPFGELSLIFIRACQTPIALTCGWSLLPFKCSDEVSDNALKEAESKTAASHGE